MDEQHRLAAETRGRGFTDAKCEGGGHRSVEGIASMLKHFHAGFGGTVVRGRDHAARRRGDPLRVRVLAIAGLEKIGIDAVWPQ
jgi:hypothetical protein